MEIALSSLIGDSARENDGFREIHGGNFVNSMSIFQLYKAIVDENLCYEMPNRL